MKFAKKDMLVACADTGIAYLNEYFVSRDLRYINGFLFNFIVFSKNCSVHFFHNRNVYIHTAILIKDEDNFYLSGLF
jgi:hypothetical protein